MRKSLSEIALKHFYQGDIDLSFSDSLLAEIFEDKVKLPGIASIDIIGFEGYLLVKVYLGVSRRFSKILDITLEFDRFQNDEVTTLLVFRIGGSMIAQLASIIGIKYKGFVSITEKKIFFDLNEMKLLQDNRQLLGYVKSIKEVNIGFSPSTILVRIKLLHNKGDILV